MERIHISKRTLLIIGIITALACFIASGWFPFLDVIPTEMTTRLPGFHELGWCRVTGVF